MAKVNPNTKTKTKNLEVQKTNVPNTKETTLPLDNKNGSDSTNEIKNEEQLVDLFFNGIKNSRY